MPKSEEREAAPLLVVEDDEDLRTAMTDLLKSEGYAVISVDSVAAARDALGRFRPVAVILDLRLQGVSSEELLAELSGLLNPQATVVVSGSKRGTDIAGEYGVLAVAKPFDIDLLVDTVKRAITTGIGRLSDSPKRMSEPGKRR